MQRVPLSVAPFWRPGVAGAPCPPLLVGSALLLACAFDERSPGLAGTAGASMDSVRNVAGGGGSAPGGSEGSSVGEPACRELACLPPARSGEVSLRLGVLGDSAGRVTVTTPDELEQECLGACAFSVAPGTVATLTALPGLNGGVRWSVPSCGSASTCTVRVDALTTVEVTMELGFNVAFVTSQTYRAYQLPRPGEAANQECTRLAAEAGLHGTRYVAWLAAEGPTTNVADDVQPADFLQRRGGWVRPDGQPVAISRASLLRGELLHPIALDPQRTLIRQRDAWAGTTAAGLLWRDPDGKAYDCDDWSDEYGLGGTAYPDSLWIGDTAPSGCSAIRRLLCFGDDSDAEVPVPASVGRLAFITASEFALGGGIAGANALCQLEACQAGLTGGTSCTTNPGTARVFRAYLHTSGQPAWTRFDLDGPTWVRPDGVPWLSDAASLATDGEGRPTLLNQTANGSYLGLFKSWTGDVERTQTCQDWTSTSQTEQGGAGVQSILTGISSGAAAPCLLGLDHRLTCLER